VLLRPNEGSDRPEILLTQRPTSMAFAGDLFVFPGGRVDETDADERFGAPPFVVAAIRELFEEAGVLLAERRDGRAIDPLAVSGAHRALVFRETSFPAVLDALGLRLRADLLAPISRWTTPPIMPRRFDTRFFAAELPPTAEPVFLTEEVVTHRWLTARAALDAMAAGELAMWVPTSATLQQLEHATGVEEVRARISPGDVPAPRVTVEHSGLTRIVLGSAGAVPGQTVNCYLVGEDELIVVDPGDPSAEAADTILGAANEARARLIAIALTHVDPDHAAGAEALALRLDLPILAGPGAGRDLPYLVREVADGDHLAAGGMELEVVATPGPRRDHVAYVLRGAGGRPIEILAGDLVGGRADQSILGAPDDRSMAASMERLRSLGPARLHPGHGDALDQ
jgi:glyoxylase-like metal-dependent hydrolase (beta-lactamase superfamily II)/8-oxo-dGTP pyrophosphatase MutT (NUDIX family)